MVKWGYECIVWVCVKVHAAILGWQHGAAAPKLLGSNAPLSASTSLLFPIFHFATPRKSAFFYDSFWHFCTVFIWLLFFAPVSVFLISLRFGCPCTTNIHLPLFILYVHTCMHTCRMPPMCVRVCVCVRNCIRLVLKVALYMHILCAWPKPIGCLLQFCAAYFFSTPPHLGYPTPSLQSGLATQAPFLGSSSSGNRLPRPPRLWVFLLQQFVG